MSSFGWFAIICIYAMCSAAVLGIVQANCLTGEGGSYDAADYQKMCVPGERSVMSYFALIVLSPLIIFFMALEGLFGVLASGTF